MSDLQQLHVDQGARFVLPYGCVVAMSGSGMFLHRGDRVGASTIRLRAQQQTVGPFYYDTNCEIRATGEAQYQVFNLRDIPQDDLNTLTTLPRGTRAVVNGGATWTPKYWNGTAWATNSGEGGGVEEAPEDGTPYVRQDAAWVSQDTAAGFTSPAGDFLWKSDATAGDPGTGRIGTNTGDPATATVLHVDNVSNGGKSVVGFLEAIREGDSILIWGRFNSENWARYVATGPAVFDTAWYEVPVSFLEASGTDPGDWTNVMASFSSGGASGAPSKTITETLHSTSDNYAITGVSGDMVSMSRAGANTVTLNTRSTDSTLEVRRPYLVRQAGAGATSFEAGSGATIVKESTKGLGLAAQHVPATAMLLDDSTWWVYGGLADA